MAYLDLLAELWLIKFAEDRSVKRKPQAGSLVIKFMKDHLEN